MRSNTLDAARRSYGGLVRGTLHAANDKPRMQTVDARLMHGELLTGIERFQHYGLNSIPLPPDPNSPKAAEVIAGFVHGNRSHPIILGVDDRRYRPTNGEAGQSGLYHFEGHALTLTKAGYGYNAGSNKKPFTVTVGNAVVTVADGKITVQVGGASGPAAVVKADMVYLGGDPDQQGGASFDFVLTASGPSSNVRAKIG